MTHRYSMAMALEVASTVLAAMLEHAARAAPYECCGILLGGARITGLVPAANVAGDPWRRFEIDPLPLIAAHKAERLGGPRVAGYYHSHPAGAPEPSATDRALAARDGRIWAIVGLGGVRFWRDCADGFESLSYTLAEG